MPDEDLGELLGPVVGDDPVVTWLKDKPGRRRTVRVRGADRSVICKQYAGDRAERVAARVGAVQDGPDEPAVPRVVALHAGRGVVVLTDVPGTTLGGAIDRRDLPACRRAGEAIGRWHAVWSGRRPADLPVHGPDKELRTLERWADRAPSDVAAIVGRSLRLVPRAWPATGVVHRDLYEEQVLLGPRVGLIDLDDLALGPAELDVGNLLAHVWLRASNDAVGRAACLSALLDGHRAGGGRLDHRLVATCTRLSLLRLACIHRRVDLATDGVEGRSSELVP